VVGATGIVLLIACSAGTLPIDRAGGGMVQLPSTAAGPEHPGATAEATTFNVSGTVEGTRGNGATVPLPDVQVIAYDRALCGRVAGPTTCGGPVAIATSESDGSYSITLPNGEYYLASGRGAAAGAPFGGTVVEENVTGRDIPGVTLAGWPYVPYGNATVVLPAFNCLSGYLWQVPSSKAGSSEQCQNPVVSWTQDGFFYVNATDELVFYSAENGSVEDFGAWTPLYTNVAGYVMVQNEEFVTQDSSYVYGWGIASPGSRTLVFEAINLTTKRHFEHNFTGVSTRNVTENGQVEMTGVDGNDSLVTLIVSTGRIVNYDLWNNTQWTGPTLPYFEANNVYWVPFLNGYVDLQANGSAGHRLSEWQLTSGDGKLSETFASSFSATGDVNGVNGWAYNVTSHTFYFSVEDARFTQDAFLANPSTGTLLTQLSSRAYTGPADGVGGGDGSIVQQSNQARGTLVSDGDLFQADAMGFENDSWIQNPSTFGYESTNVTPLTYFWGAGAMSTGTSWASDSMFFNTSYLYSEASIDCSAGEKTGVDGLCSIEGKSGAVPGTVYWFWKLGLPEFPFPATNSIAEPDAPLAATTTLSAVNASSVRITWYPSTFEPQPILNWTLVSKVGRNATTYESLWAENRSIVLSGLRSGENLSWCVEAWNLHWHGPCLMGSSVVGAPALPSPEDLASVSVGPSWIDVAWTNPSVPISGDTTFLGPFEHGSCGDLSVASPPGLGTVASYNFTGLLPSTPYCVAVSDENSTEVSFPSPSLTLETLSGLAVAPSAPTFPFVTNASVFVAWRQASFPDGLPDNDTVLAGTTCGDWTFRASTGGAATSFDLLGLAPATTYCVAIEAWFGSGAQSQSLVGPTASVSTVPLARAPTAPTFENVSDHSAVVAWTQGFFPDGAVGNDTILVGRSCGAWTEALSTGGPATSATIDDLAVSTRYCVAVEAWNGTSGTFGSLTGPSAWVTTEPVTVPPPWNPAVAVPAIALGATLIGAGIGATSYRLRTRPPSARR
jgi:hypothetical protein